MAGEKAEKPRKKKPTIAIIEDEKTLANLVAEFFKSKNYNIAIGQTLQEGRKIIKKEKPDIVILDVKLPDGDGLTLLKEIVGVPVIVISGYGTVEMAVEAVRNGAFDFLEKPFDLKRLGDLVERALSKAPGVEVELVGESPAMKELKKKIELAAKSDSRVLITGENGAGKEVVARAIHSLSLRSTGPFVAINCAAIPSSLMEAELFGYEKGAFTGAYTSKKGKFELADGGTLFLDEIGDMPPELQAKLLRFLQEGEITRVGGLEPVKVDVRVISATNRDLSGLIKQGLFREDLFYRLNVIPLYVPPLREHKEDIPLLVEHFLKKMGMEKEFSQEAIEVLMDYNWPGNIRQLKNLVERVVVLTPSDTITAKDVIEALKLEVHGEKISHAESEKIESGSQISDDLNQLQEALEENSLEKAKSLFEKIFLRKKLQENEWNISKTAKAIGVNRSHLHRLLKKHNLV